MTHRTRLIDRRRTAATGLLAAGLATALAAAALLAAPAPAAAQSPCGAGYTVRTGDSLLEIAERCGITIPALLAANPAVRDRMDLEVGDRLRIPSPGDPQPSPQEACGPYYTVRTGDTLAEIAEKCGLTVPLLVAANGPLPDPLGIHTGARIRIPDLPERAVRDPGTLAFPPAGAAAAAAADEARPEAEVEADVETEAAEAPVERGAEVEAEEESEEEEEMIRLEGVLTTGERCLLVDAGERGAFALVGRLTDAFRPGDRVVVMGLSADPELCAHTPALEVRILYRPQ